MQRAEQTFLAKTADYALQKMSHCSSQNSDLRKTFLPRLRFFHSAWEDYKKILGKQSKLNNIYIIKTTKIILVVLQIFYFGGWKGDVRCIRSHLALFYWVIIDTEAVSISLKSISCYSRHISQNEVPLKCVVLTLKKSVQAGNMRLIFFISK